MALFVRNPEGDIHAVPDGWKIPLGADDNPQQGWVILDRSEVPPALLVNPVVAVPAVVEDQVDQGVDEATEAAQEPAHAGYEAAEEPSTAQVGPGEYIISAGSDEMA